MKTIFKGFLCLSMLLVYSGCGKDKGSSSSSSSTTSLYNNGLAADSQTALQNITNWYNTTNEGSLPVLNYPVNIVRKEYTSSVNGSCQNKTFLGIDFQYCSYSNNNSNSGTEISRVNNAILTNPGPVKSSNPALAEVFSGAAGTLYEARQLSSTAYVLNFVNSNGSVVSYTIDTSYHSSFNPVIKTEMLGSISKNTVFTTY